MTTTHHTSSSTGSAPLYERPRPTFFRDELGVPRLWIFCVSVVAVIAAVIAVIVPIVWHTEHVTCLRLHEQTGYPTRMAGNAWSGGCYINPGTRYIPVDRYINADVNPTE